MISKVMKPLNLKEEKLGKIDYPVYTSPKLDGIRAICTGDEVLSSSLKRIPNEYIQSVLSEPEYAGLDGELIVGDPNDKNSFNNTTGDVRRIKGRPDFTFHVFDYFLEPDMSFAERIRRAKANMETLERVELVQQEFAGDRHDTLRNIQEYLENGYEGAILRDPRGIYKYGRSTMREQIIFKIKPVEDAEGVIVGLYEQLDKNGNPKDTLGGFDIQSSEFKVEFGVGTGVGLTKELRQKIWDNKEKYVGRTIVFKYQKYGSINAPRQPIFKGFRDTWDLTTGY